MTTVDQVSWAVTQLLAPEADALQAQLSLDGGAARALLAAESAARSPARRHQIGKGFRYEDIDLAMSSVVSRGTGACGEGGYRGCRCSAMHGVSWDLSVCVAVSRLVWVGLYCSG